MAKVYVVEYLNGGGRHVGLQCVRSSLDLAFDWCEANLSKPRAEACEYTRSMGRGGQHRHWRLKVLGGGGGFLDVCEVEVDAGVVVKTEDRVELLRLNGTAFHVSRAELHRLHNLADWQLKESGYDPDSVTQAWLRLTDAPQPVEVDANDGRR